jgi:hypothetical protein
MGRTITRPILHLLDLSMYSTCLFCNRPLGENHTFESFPVGKRLAFDATKGRLWVVCPKCERWNLTPLEERWEVIERSEALYRDTRRRVASDQIGLAKLADGTELVRIGEPLRPEFAAWRYGDQFGRRRRRQMLIAGASLGAIGAIVVGGAVAGVGVGAFGWMIANAGRAAINGNPEGVVARIRTQQAGMVAVRRRHLAETRITKGTEGPLAVDLRFKGGSAHFEGEEAQRIAAIVVPHANRFGGARESVQGAVSMIESSGGPEGFLERIAQTAAVVTRAPVKRRRQNSWSFDAASTGLFGLSRIDRLALEMSLHEEAERRAMQGELAVLARAWQEAEEIAGIADDLLLPGTVQSAVDRMRAR